MFTLPLLFGAGEWIQILVALVVFIGWIISQVALSGRRASARQEAARRRAPIPTSPEKTPGPDQMDDFVRRTRASGGGSSRSGKIEVLEAGPTRQPPPFLAAEPVIAEIVAQTVDSAPDTPGDTPKPPVPDHDRRETAHAGVSASDIAEALRDPGSAGRAIILGEILARSEHQRPLIAPRGRYPKGSSGGR